jgi:hypothetical protein
MQGISPWTPAADDIAVLVRAPFSASKGGTEMKNRQIGVIVTLAASVFVVSMVLHRIDSP